MAAVAGPVDPISAFSISYGGQSCGGTHGVDDAAAHAARSRLFVGAAIGDPCPARVDTELISAARAICLRYCVRGGRLIILTRTAIRNPAKFMVWSGLWR